MKTDFVKEITALKEQPGKDLCILGSSDLAVSFLEAGLLDEIRILLNPIVLGAGKPLFKGIQNRLKLKLLEDQDISRTGMSCCITTSRTERRIPDVETYGN